MTRDGDRIIDASLNRCAEALRVVEDICRFQWNLAGASRELKELRHQVLTLLVPDPARRGELARARDIEGDAGREIPSPAGAVGGEAGTEVLRTAVRNLERAKEALRTLEEVCRERAPSPSAALESLRYRLYSLEKGLLRVARPGAGILSASRLCLLVTRALAVGPLEEILRGAIEGGVDAIQMREKGGSDRSVLDLGRRLRELTAAAEIPLVVNDRADLATLLGADAVHLGQDDLPVAEARKIIAAEMGVGVSTHSVEEARKAFREGADYIGIGPVFSTRSKRVGPPIGAEGFRAILEQTDLPAFAIGGIGPENIGLLAAAGADRVAVSASILGATRAEEARAAARAIVTKLPPP